MASNTFDINLVVFFFKLFQVIILFCHLVVLVRLSLLQVIDWKDSSLKLPVMC